jgi:hypothetical protein
LGLHLCYRLTLPGTTAVDMVREKLSALKDFASTIGFDRVHDLAEYTIDELVEKGDVPDIVCIVASTMCGDPPDFYGVPAGGTCALAFGIAPGEECEAAMFGFLAPGSRNGNEDDDLCPGEWVWSYACKTQYASIVSDEHLLKCHDGLVRVLDHAAALGITVTVEDETGYWDHRSPTTLFKVVRDMNRLIARFAGEMESRWHGRHRIEAPIFDHPDFEHLEMESLESHDQADGSDPEAS